MISQSSLRKDIAEPSSSKFGEAVSSFTSIAKLCTSPKYKEAVFAQYCEAIMRENFMPITVSSCAYRIEKLGNQRTRSLIRDFLHAIRAESVILKCRNLSCRF